MQLFPPTTDLNLPGLTFVPMRLSEIENETYLNGLEKLQINYICLTPLRQKSKSS